jgi:hypothetical protein
MNAEFLEFDAGDKSMNVSSTVSPARERGREKPAERSEQKRHEQMN